MKKAKSFIKRNIKLLIGFILGIIISAGGVYAAIVIQGSSVGYTDNYSLGATTVQAAIDKLYTTATPDNILTTKVFANKTGVCIYRKNRLHCFKINNYDTEKTHVQTVFSDASCTVSDFGYVQCIASDFMCLHFSNGQVGCNEGPNGTYPGCTVDQSGNVTCI